MNCKEIINKWKLNQTVLAQMINMPTGTFKNKFSENQRAYKFTSQEEKLLINVLKELSKDIQSINSNVSLEAEIKNVQKVAELMNSITKEAAINFAKRTTNEIEAYVENPRFKIVNGKKVFK